MSQQMLRADAALEKDDGETLRRLYEKARQEQAHGTFGGMEAIGVARKYGNWLHQHRRYEEALSVWRFALTPRSLMHNERIECHFALAECLLALDRPEQMEREALQPLERLLGPKLEEWPMSEHAAKIAQFRYQFLHEAKLRRKAFRPSPLAPPDLTSGLSQDYQRRMDIALAYYNGGHLKYALKHIDVAGSVAENAGQRVRAYTLEAFWLRACGEIQRAENRIRQALNEAGEETELQQRAQTAWALHLLEMGRIAECEPVLERLRQLPGDYPPAWNLLGDYHTLRGRYAEAREALGRIPGSIHSEPFLERRQIAAGEMAFVLVDLNAAYFGEIVDFAATRIRLETAQRILRGDAKLSLWLTAMEAALYAYEGQEAAARERLQLAESQFGEFENDPTTQETVCSLSLGTYLHLGEYEPARQWGERYLTIGKRPVYRAGVQEKLANTYEGLGDGGRASELRRNVMETGFPIMAVNAARAKLEV